MTIQPVLLYSSLFAKEKSCASENFCSKATTCSAKKTQPNQAKSCSAKREQVSEKKSCSSKKATTPSKGESEKGCTETDCGPFTVCSSCCIIPMDRPVFSFSYFIQKTEKARLINENILSNYISDLWHPPEFV